MDIRAGQRWSYRSRPHEQESRVVIGLVEGNTMHVSLDGLVVCGPQGICRSVGHLPVHRDALAASLVELEGPATSPDGFADGIATWREARGGVFTIPLREIIEGIEWGMSTPTEVLDHLVVQMRSRQLESMVDDVTRAVRKQPELVFLGHPDSANTPLMWQFPGRSLCVVVFTNAERARAFANLHGLDSALITPPNADAAFAFLRQLRDDDGIEWASVNPGDERNVPFYLDQL